MEFLGSFNSYALEAFQSHLMHSQKSQHVLVVHEASRITAAFPWTHLGLGMAPKVPGSSSSPGSAEPKSLAGHCSAQKAELLGSSESSAAHMMTWGVTGSLSKISIHQGTGIYIYLFFIIIYLYIYIWVNYNDLTATEPWNHGQ